MRAVSWNRSSLRCTLAFALALSSLAPGARAAQDKLKFEVEQLQVDGKVRSVDAVDLDGDGKLDLVAAVVKGKKREAQRSLAIFWNHSGSFAGKPDLIIPLAKEICAYDFASLDGQPARALLLIDGRGVTAQRFRRAGAAPG